MESDLVSFLNQMNFYLSILHISFNENYFVMHILCLLIKKNNLLKCFNKFGPGNSQIKN